MNKVRSTTKKIKQGDEVVVICGKEKGQKAKVKRLDARRGKVWLESLNLVSRHMRPNPRRNVQGGVLRKEAPLDVSNVMLYNPVSQQPERVAWKHLDDGRKVRYFRSTQTVLDASSASGAESS